MTKKLIGAITFDTIVSSRRMHQILHDLLIKGIYIRVLLENEAKNKAGHLLPKDTNLIFVLSEDDYRDENVVNSS